MPNVALNYNSSLLAQERSFRGGYYMTHCELHISSTHVWIEDEKSGVREQSSEFVYYNIIKNFIRKI